MKTTIGAKQILVYFLLFFIITIGCKRNDGANNNPTNPNGPVNDATQVTASSVTGVVLDESNLPIANAAVTCGTATTTTNSYGFFVFNNISLSKENGSVTVVKAGYFKGVRSFKTIENKNNAVRIQLMQKTLSGTLNAATGGIINSNGNTTINFPANAFVTSAGAAYTGTVRVYSRWIDPTAANLPFIMPGDLRGVRTDGTENILTTYGMVGAELEDVNGNSLKIAPGKKATISSVIPTTILSSAPATIPLWHFDDATARWKENGIATKVGSTYTTEVDKFSFWNYDGPGEFIILDYTLINAATSTPLVNANTRIKVVSNGSYGYGITNNTGFVSGAVPKNQALILEVVSTCNTVIYTQNIGSFTSNTSLGNIIVNMPSTNYLNFTGTIVNCNNVPINDGYIAFYGSGGNNAFVNVSSSGNFAFTILHCNNGSLAYTYQVTDYTANLQSDPISGSAVNGNINLGNIAACANTAGPKVYIAGYEKILPNTTGKYWKNGVVSNFSGCQMNGVFVSGNDVYLTGTQSSASMASTATVWKNGIPTHLSNGIISTEANSVFINGTDVYVAGVEWNIVSGVNISKAKMWKNGIGTDLTNGTKSAVAQSIYVSGSDVYIAGYEYETSTLPKAKLWKNGVVSHLGVNSSKANSVFVKGTDVYVAGYDYVGNSSALATLWKNGVATSLTSGVNLAHANSVFVDNSDVYVAGNEYDGFAGKSKAKLWKNGIKNNLSDVSVPNVNNFATSVYVISGDVYVVGHENYAPNNGSIAKYWKNGIETNLNIYNPSMSSIASSVFVK